VFGADAAAHELLQRTEIARSEGNVGGVLHAFGAAPAECL